MSIATASKHPLERRRIQREPKRAITPRRAREAAEAEVAGYISQMATEMMVLASRANLDLLAYLLSIARTEAEAVANRGFTDSGKA